MTDETKMFDEYSLLADIIEKWGEYGAHAEICRWMIEEIYRLQAEVERLELIKDPPF